MFKRLEGDTAVLYTKGVYKQADLYEWEGGLYASVGGGFVRLTADGRTSVPTTVVKQITTDIPLWTDRFNRLSTIAGVNFTKLDSFSVLKLTEE